MSKLDTELLLIPKAIAAPILGNNVAGDGSAQRAPGSALPPGKKIMAIDLRLCVDCNNCEDACGRRHGIPRISRETQGKQYGIYHVPNACYHCEDPKCLMCDVGGIVREKNGEIRIVEENCIGCGACADRCPYGNIKMIDREARQKTGAITSLFQLVGLARKGVSAAVPTNAKRLASKCDLCFGHKDGPACVRACPTGAAGRRSPDEIARGGR